MVRNTYGDLLKPTQIGTLKLKNCICMAPMDFKYFIGNEEDSSMTHKQAKVFEARAKGGCGLIFTCATHAERKVMPYPRGMQFPAIDRVERIKEFAEAADLVHTYGAKIACELTMGSGRYADFVEGAYPPIAPSECETQYDPTIRARQMTIEEIKYMIRTYAEAAGRLKTAGFDALLVMGGGGYLINQFLSPAWNQRNDQYGGSLEKRMTFLIETLTEVKKVVGASYPIIVSLNMDDLLPEGVSKCPGLVVEDAIATAKKLEELGLADAFHLRIGNYYNQEYIIPSAYVTNNLYKENFIKFKHAVTKPVIFENKMSDPQEMQEMLKNGDLDFVSMGRSWIADENWVQKVQYEKQVRPCLRCNYCLHTLWLGKSTSCAVNPRLGHEDEEKLTLTTKKKKIVVIGAGPGGIEAALVASARGHEVLLLEKENRVGGKLDIVAAPDYKKQYLGYLSFLESELEKSEVKVHCNIQANAEIVDCFQPDVVILATGADPIIPPLPGISMAIPADTVLRNHRNVSGTVVIVGGGLVGCETAHVLSQKGCKVHIVEMRDDVLKDTSYVTRHSQLDLLERTGACIHTSTKLLEVQKDGVLVENNGIAEKIMADYTVLAVGYRNKDSLYEEFQDLVEEVYQIGDCKQTRKIADAIREGYFIAKEI